MWIYCDDNRYVAVRHGIIIQRAAIITIAALCEEQ